MKTTNSNKLHGTQRQALHERAIDMTGQKVGRLTFLRPTSKPADSPYGGQHWVALCDCGNVVVVCGYAVRFGMVRSCGCLQKLYRQSRRHHVPYRREEIH